MDNFQIDKRFKLDNNNLKDFFENTSLKMILNVKNYWHHFSIINGANIEKDVLLKAILEQVQPFELIPCKYRRVKNDATFLAKHCSQAIEKLAKSGLQLKIQNKQVIYLQLQIIPAFALFSEIHFNVFKHLEMTFEKKYLNHCLDLSDYHNDPDISRFIYIPLLYPKNLSYLLSACKKTYSPTLVEVSLAKNELTSLKPLELLVTCPNLKSLDLSHNKIEQVTELQVLQMLKLTTLNLDNNPVCKNWSGVLDYIWEMKRYCPNLIILDGFRIQDKMPPLKKTFLISNEAESFVDHFLTHFFSRYDSKDRDTLAGIYHPKSQFSLTTTYIPGQTTSENSRLNDYIHINRNMIRCSDYTKSHHHLYQGSNNILDILRKLPRTQHDPYSISVDLSIYTRSLIMITVTGVFREPLYQKAPSLRMFQRVFILTYTGGTSGDEYRIVNDMLHVSNATTEQHNRCFKKPCPKLYNPKIYDPWPPENNLPKILNHAEKFQMSKVLSQITTMNQEWSYKCLEEMKWELQEALEVFTRQFKRGNIPKKAFAE